MPCKLAIARSPMARKTKAINTSIKEKPDCFSIIYGVVTVTLPVDGVSVNRLCVPLVFCNVRLPVEEVEFGLNTALVPAMVIAAIDTPDGKAWLAPSVIQFPLPAGGFSY